MQTFPSYRLDGAGPRMFFHHLAFLCAIAVFAFGSVNCPAAAQDSVKIDFAAQLNPKPLSGFLGSLNAFNPPDSRTIPLHPALWRTSAVRRATQARILNFGARFEFMLSTNHAAKDNWGGLGRPDVNGFANFPAWANYVTQTTSQLSGIPVLWDVWNEPDLGSNWPGSAAAFYEMYSRLYGVLRAQLGPNALIGGPSISRYDSTYLTNFLEYCLQAGVEVNFLSWHELRAADPAIPDVASHLAEARTNFVNNPRYAPLHIQEIQINESVGSANQYSPGAITGYLYYMEKGGADAATKACWPDLSGSSSNCSNASIDGLLTSDFHPRAAWWVYQAYADGVSSRVTSESSDPRLIALASAQNASANQAQVLVGYFDYQNSPPATSATVTLLNLQALPQAGAGSTVHVKVQQIPNTLEQPVDTLPVISESDMTVSGGSVSVPLSNIGLNEAYLITIGSPGPAASVLSDVSAASYSSAGAAPESIVSAFGTSLAASTESASTTVLPTSLANTTVTVQDSSGTARQAPLFFVSPTQVNYLVPAGTAAGAATVTVTGGSSASGTIQVQPFLPGLFSANGNGQGVAAANLLRIRADGSRSIEDVAQLDSSTGTYLPAPIALGPPSDQLYLILYGTGIRGASGTVTVLLNEQEIPAAFTGPQGEYDGLDQVNVPLPRNLAGPTISVAVFAAGRVSNSVQIVIQ